MLRIYLSKITQVFKKKYYNFAPDYEPYQKREWGHSKNTC